MNQNNKGNSIADGFIGFLKIIVILLIILICLVFGFICGMSTYKAIHPVHCPLPNIIDNDAIDGAIK